MFQITYETIGVVQMTFLRLLSQEAYQNFTYTCINSAAWFNLKTNNHDMAIKLLGENEIEFGTEGIRPSVVVDGCKVSIYILTRHPKYSTHIFHIHSL
jgi:collagen type V/XI/XXIV/XXVII alpha